MNVGRGSPAAQTRLPGELKALQHQIAGKRRNLSSEIVLRLELSRKVEDFQNAKQR